MIGVFPTIRPDELLYSAFARYQEMMAFPSILAVRRQLFGLTSVTAVVDLPGHLNRFVERLPPGHPYTVDRLLFEHTLFPYYTRFVPCDRVRAAYAALCGDGSRGVHRMLSVTGTAVRLPRKLLFCPQCAEEDQLAYGNTYWRRTHQTPGVLVCSAHSLVLRDGGIARAARLDRYGYHVLSEDIVRAGRSVFVPRKAIGPLRAIAEDTQWLLSHRGHPADLEADHARYRQLALEGGWIDTSGRLQAAAFERAFEGHYGAEFFDLIGVKLEGAGSGDTWVSRMFQLPRTTHPPLCNLLLQNFLGTCAEGFFSGADSSDESREEGAAASASATAIAVLGQAQTVEVGPCRNPICQRSNIQAARTLGPSSGRSGHVTVSCPSCGFSYWYDSNCPSIWTVRDVGAVWEAALRRMVDETEMPQKEIAAALGVTVNLLVRLAWDLGVTRPSWRKRKASQQKISMRRVPALGKRKQHRAHFTSFRKANPKLGRTDLRLGIPTTYAWLYRHDRDWLEHRLPHRRPPGGRRDHVDWGARDLEFSEAVGGAVRRIRTVPGRPRRVTVTAIGRYLWSAACLNANLYRLPRTRAIIDDVVESLAAFGARRLRWAADEFIRRGMIPTREALVKRAGFATHAAAEHVGDLEQLRQEVRQAVAGSSICPRPGPGSTSSPSPL